MRSLPAAMLENNGKCMKLKFFIYSFMLGFVIMAISASAYHELRVRQSDEFFQQIALFRNPEIQPDVLVVGDSRLAMAVRQELLPPSVYNLSYPGQSLQEIYLRVKFALEVKPSIRYLVIGLEDPTLTWLHTTPFLVPRQLLYADLEDLTEVYPANPRFLIRNGLVYYFPLINRTERGLVVQRAGDDVSALIDGAAPPRSRLTIGPCGGFRLIDVRWGQYPADVREKIARERAAYLLSEDSPQVREQIGDATPDHPPGQFITDPRMQAALRRLLALAESRGVAVIGVRAPVSAEYLAAARAFGIDRTFDFYRRQNLAAMLEYHELFAGRTELFADADHLNDAGAVLFTERLVADLKPLTGISGQRRPQCLPPPDWHWPYNDILTDWLQRPRLHGPVPIDFRIDEDAAEPVAVNPHSGLAKRG